jgi:cation transport ATPase
LSGIPIANTISRRSIHRTAFSFGWSVVVDVFTILLGAGAFVYASILPELAELRELGTVSLVVTVGVVCF